VIPFDALDWRALRVWNVIQSLILRNADAYPRVGGIPVREIRNQLREWSAQIVPVMIRKAER
jgi:hypothetical protein